MGQTWLTSIMFSGMTSAWFIDLKEWNTYRPPLFHFRQSYSLSSAFFLLNFRKDPRGVEISDMRTGITKVMYMHLSSERAWGFYHRQFKTGQRDQSDNISEGISRESAKVCESRGHTFDRILEDGYGSVGVAAKEWIDEVLPGFLLPSVLEKNSK